MKRWFIEVTCTGKENNPNFPGCVIRLIWGKKKNTVARHHITDVNGHSDCLPDFDWTNWKGQEYGYSTERNALSALTAYLKHDVQEKYWDNTYKVISMEL